VECTHATDRVAWRRAEPALRNFVQLADQAADVVLAGVGSEGVQAVGDANLLAPLVLRAGIDFARRRVADQHGVEDYLHAFLSEGADRERRFSLDALGERFAVDDPCPDHGPCIPRRRDERQPERPPERLVGDP